MAEAEVAETLTDPHATSAQLRVEEIADAHWKVELPRGTRGKNIVLIHSTENAQNFIKGLLAILALRQNQVESVFLINTYQGYSRQDRAFEPGQGVSANIMLQVFNRFLSNNLAVSLHYGDTTRMISLPEENRVIRDEEGRWINDLLPRKVFNLNGVVSLSEKIVDKIIEDLKYLTGDYPSAIEEFLKHPIVIISPDDGGFKPAKEAARVLKKYISRKYGIAEEDINILVGYLEKKRVSPGEITIEEGSGILTEVDGETRPLEIPTTLDDCWIILLDDEISTGDTILRGVWYLVEELGADWSKIYTGGVHGKFVEGLERFEIGWIDKDNMLMAPQFLLVTNSYPLRFDITPYPNIKTMSIQRLITFAIKKILGKRVTIEGL